MACLLTWAALGSALPRPNTTPPPAPVLETVTPAQLATMGVRLEPTLQPHHLPALLTRLGVRLPGTIIAGGEARAVVRHNNGGIRTLVETVLSYATLFGPAFRAQGPVVSHRLVWVVVGVRRSVSGPAALIPALWLVDARTPHELIELAVPAVPRMISPALPASAPAGH